MREILSQFSWWSALDIAILSYIIYQILLLIRGTRAAQMLTGVLVVIAAFLLSSVVPLTALNWMMNKFYSSFIIILIILFQDDIRLALSRIGKKSFIANTETASSSHLLDEITKGAGELASNSIGALIVFERSILLNRYIDFGSLLDARISKDIVLAIFHTSSPIHDGAIIIQEGRIAAAGCFLPLTRDEYLDPNMGTRHRAAIGVSQETDALVILVSEEDSTISIAIDGKFISNLSTKTLRKALQKHMVDEIEYIASVEKAPAAESRTLLNKIRLFRSGQKP